jgi:hypothetical protein
MNLNENQVQIIDNLKTEFLRINETNKQHKVGKLINFNQMASDKEEMRKKRDEDRAISKANKSRCKEEFYKAIEVLNEDLKYVGLWFEGHKKYIRVENKDCIIKIGLNYDEVDYGGYFEEEYRKRDTFHFLFRTYYGMMGGGTEAGIYLRFETIEELANSELFVQYVKDNGDFDSATINLSDQKEVSHA